MANRILPTPEQLREILECYPDTGRLFWKTRDIKWFKNSRSCNSFNARDAGTEALTASNPQGYRMGIVMGVPLLAHRVVWAHHYGYWPELAIDHANCDPEDNRISNLRLATSSENARNKFKYKNNTSGFKGASWFAPLNKWSSKIRLHDKLIHLGYFHTPEDAHAAYCEASKIYHGEFARTK